VEPTLGTVGYVKMPDYRLGNFLAARAMRSAEVNFGIHKGRRLWQEFPGEYRIDLRRVIVTQGDTEPASVNKPADARGLLSIEYDLRNIFQVNVEEGRPLWAMVYCCTVTSDEMAARKLNLCSRGRSGDAITRASWRVQRGHAGIGSRSHVHVLHRPRW